jgi:FdhE protein
MHVGTNFLRKLVGREATPPPEVGGALEELTRLAKERPTLAGPARLLAEILPALFADSAAPAAVPLTSEQAEVKLQQSLPLLRGETVRLDIPGFSRRWQQICLALEQQQPGADVKGVAQALRRKQLDPQWLLDETLAGRPEAIHRRADELGLDAGLTATVLRLSLFPLMVQLNAALAPLRDGCGWEHGYCVTCGSWPLLGEFRGLEQTRFLRCGLCAAQWEFPRLRCPFCNTADHRELGYFYVDTEEEREKYRAATCGACKGYVKMVSTLGELSPPRLLVADVATMHLDLAAAERGYRAEIERRTD